MPNIFTLFNRSIKWNTFEAVIYQTILTIHQILLFSVVDRTQYARIGIIFSILFLSLIFINLGFDKSIISFFNNYTNSKSTFKKYFIRQLFIQLFLLITIAILVNLFSSYIDEIFSIKFKCEPITYLNWILISLLLISEGLKKSLRNFAQLAFLNKQTSIIEVFGITFYFILVWTQYLTKNNINLTIILVPFLIESLISNLLLILIVFKYYKKNIISNEVASQIKTKEIISNRFYVYINQVTHLFFTGNFIIPYLGYLFTLEQVSLLKLTNNITIFITVFMERIFGITSAALFSHVSKIGQTKSALNISTERLYKFLYAIIIFLIINFKFLTSFKFSLLNINWLPVYLFLFLIFFENFFITYEQFLISEKKSQYLMVTNGICAFLFYLFSISIMTGRMGFNALNIQEILILLIMIRILALITLRLICYAKMEIQLPFKIKYQYIVLYTLISLIFYFFSKFIR